MQMSPMVGAVVKWVHDLWSFYSSLGVGQEDEGPKARRIILSNRVAAITFLLGLGIMLYFLSATYSHTLLNWFVLLLAVVWAIPLFNAMGSTLMSRHVLSTFLPLFTIALVAHTRVSIPDVVHEASFYIPRFYLMAISFFPLLLFGPDERRNMYASFGVNVLILLSFNELMDLFGAGMGLIEPSVRDAYFISVSSAISLLLIGVGFFMLNQLNHNYELRIGELLEETASKNRRIGAAINYAKDLQKVVLPRKEVLDSLGDGLFVVYRPLDVVSGDFYMVREVENRLLLAVVDCTGHGVPGAFVSMLAHSALQRAVNRLGAESPAAVVAEVSRLFNEDLGRSGNPDINDGMDIVMASLDRNTLELRISGANLSAYMVQGGQMNVHRCERGYIYRGNADRSFADATVQLQQGDMLYLTSDGIPDQFGGPDDKRFGKHRLMEQLTAMAPLPLPEQEQRIVSLMDEWKGADRQTDDICMVGLQV